MGWKGDETGNPGGPSGIDDVEGLAAALAAKYSDDNSPGISDVSGLAAALAEKYSDSNLPGISDVTGLPAALALKLESVSAAEMPTGIDASKLADGSVSNAEFQRINSVTSNVQDQLDGKLTNANITTSANALISGTNILAIYVTSTDGADDGRASLNGGGADGQSSRGARLVCFGNEHASSAGDVNIVLGAVAGAALTVTDNTAVARLVVSETGVQVVGTVTVTNGAVNVAGTSTPTMGLGRDGLGNLAIVSTWALTVTTPGGVTFGNAVDVATAAVAVPSTTFTTVRAVAISPCRISATVVGMGCAEFYWDGTTLSVWKGLADTNIVAASSAASGEVAWRMSGGNLQASNNTGSSKNCYAGLVKR